MALALSVSAAVATLGCNVESPPSPLEPRSTVEGASDTDLRALDPARPASDKPGIDEPGIEEPGSVAFDDAGIVNPETCWQLPAVNRARLYGASGRAADLGGGKIVGSNTSATNGFVDLAVVTAPTQEQWVDIHFVNATPYRYVKYYAPAGSYGAIAELELYVGEDRVSGASFGSAGSLESSGTAYGNALDGEIATWFEGPLPNDNYVGLDLGDGHVTAAPVVTPNAGSLASGDTVTLSAVPGASIQFSIDGSDPLSAGTPYTGPISLPDGSSLLRAVATSACALDSEETRAIYQVGTTAVLPSAQRAVQSSMHIGNSLTDTVVEYLVPVALSGGITLDFNRYTIPGAGAWLYEQNPTGGFGVANVQEALLARPFDHVTMQPYPNLPCQPLPSSDGNDSDAGYLNRVWADARTQNPAVQFWVYHQWPAPTDYVTCFSGGGWTRGDWQPAAPESWEHAVATELSYQEAVRAELVRLNPGAPAPYIIPGGVALVALKRAIDAGQVPGMTNFFGSIFLASGADIHLTRAGAYYVTLVFYACMFQRTPVGLANETGGELTDEQAALFQQLAWDTATGYPWSGVSR